MKKRYFYLFIFAFLSPILSACESLQEINWLLGSWQVVSEKRASFESWEQIDENHFSGLGVQLSLPVSENIKPPFVEFLSISVMGDELFYIAKPQKNSLPVAFKATVCSNSLVRFENKKHDFPQSITYKKINDTELKVEVKSAQSSGFELNFQLDKVVSKSKSVGLVNDYIQAFNNRSMQSMLNLLTEDINWFSVGKNGIVVPETRGKTALFEAMSSYFQSPQRTFSSLYNVQAFARFVIATEKASWENEGQINNQCSHVIYQFNHVKIANVWYYPSTTCERSLLSTHSSEN